MCQLIHSNIRNCEILRRYVNQLVGIEYSKYHVSAPVGKMTTLKQVRFVLFVYLLVFVHPNIAHDHEYLPWEK